MTQLRRLNKLGYPITQDLPVCFMFYIPQSIQRCVEGLGIAITPLRDEIHVRKTHFGGGGGITVRFLAPSCLHASL